MTPYDQAQKYLAAIPPAISGSGGHAQTLSAARALVWGFTLPVDQARSLLHDWNRQCVPPWSDTELEHKLVEADRVDFGKPRGYLLKANGNKPHRKRYTPSPMPSPPTAKPAPKYDLEPAAIPEPIEDGARNLIHALFLPGEGIRICPARLNDEGREVPEGEGIVLSREEWLRKLEKVKGDPNGIFSSSKRTGIYITVNPMALGGSKDADVTAYRHCLVEFDNISQEEQFALYTQSRIPCAAIIDSGGKSIHAWVKVDAKDRREYDERVKSIYEHFSAYGLDVKNKNPSRFSRLPNCIRFDRRQELIALNAGAESFSAWQGEVQCDGIGHVMTLDQLEEYDTENDANTLVGKRYLCKGGSVLIVGPSGVGKSSLSLQMVMTWAIGRDFCGISPVKPLKTLIVQAENDDGDMAEVVQGVLAGMKIAAFDSDYQVMKQNLVFVRDTTHTGEAFTEAVRRLIDRYKPDLVMFDPLLSFIGDDISRQEVCSHFLRNLLNPISEATGVAWICVHHTGKPPTDKDARKGWQSGDWSYAGIGSSELTNWTRAAMVLRQAGEGTFELKLSKRGKRAGATHPELMPTQTLWIKHADVGINWQQIDPPEEPEHQHKKGRAGRPVECDITAADNTHSFLAKCPADGEGLNEIAKRLSEWLATEHRETRSWKTCKATDIPKLFKCGKLDYKDGKYYAGSNK